jgi:hypothetical protein
MSLPPIYFPDISNTVSMARYGTAATVVFAVLAVIALCIGVGITIGKKREGESTMDIALFVGEKILPALLIPSLAVFFFSGFIGKDTSEQFEQRKQGNIERVGFYLEDTQEHLGFEGLDAEDFIVSFADTERYTSIYDVTVNSAKVDGDNTFTIEFSEQKDSPAITGLDTSPNTDS